MCSAVSLSPCLYLSQKIELLSIYTKSNWDVDAHVSGTLVHVCTFVFVRVGARTHVLILLETLLLRTNARRIYQCQCPFACV